MSPNESKSSTNQNHVRFFTAADFDPASVGKKWDLIKIVCVQPFVKTVPFGVCFLKVHGEAEKGLLPVKPAEEPSIAVGTFFRKRQEGASETAKPMSSKLI